MRLPWTMRTWGKRSPNAAACITPSEPRRISRASNAARPLISCLAPRHRSHPELRRWSGGIRPAGILGRGGHAVGICPGHVIIAHGLPAHLAPSVHTLSCEALVHACEFLAAYLLSRERGPRKRVACPSLPRATTSARACSCCRPFWPWPPGIMVGASAQGNATDSSGRRKAGPQGGGRAPRRGCRLRVGTHGKAPPACLADSASPPGPPASSRDWQPVCRPGPEDPECHRVIARRGPRHPTCMA